MDERHDAADDPQEQDGQRYGMRDKGFDHGSRSLGGVFALDVDFVGEGEQEFFLGFGVFHRITMPAEQLQVADMVGATVGFGDDEHTHSKENGRRGFMSKRNHDLLRSPHPTQSPTLSAKLHR